MRTSIRKGFTLLELMIVVAIIGLLATLAISNFDRFRLQSRRSEVEMNLRALWTLEKARYAEADSYTASMEHIGFAPERANRFAYKLTGACSVLRSRAGVAEVIPSDYHCVTVDTFKLAGATPLPPCALDAAVTTGNTGAFRACGVGNIDGDTAFDSWSIASATRDSGVASSDTACAADRNAGGEPCLDESDI